MWRKLSVSLPQKQREWRERVSPQRETLPQIAFLNVIFLATLTVFLFCGLESWCFIIFLPIHLLYVEIFVSDSHEIIVFENHSKMYHLIFYKSFCFEWNYGNELIIVTAENETVLSYFRTLCVHGVWKSQKKSHSTLRAKRATFTFRMDKR